MGQNFYLPYFYNQINQSQQNIERSIVDTAFEAASNIPASAGKFVKDVTYPILNPIQTAEGILSLGKGLVKLAAPGQPTLIDEDEEVAKAVGQFFVDRYGSIDKIKETIAKDPVGFMSDASAIFTLGGGIVTKLPSTTAKSVGDTLTGVGKQIDPLGLPGKTARITGDVAAEISGKLSGTGPEAIKTAFEAGMKGGQAAKFFRQNLLAKVSPEEAVIAAKRGIERIKRNRNLAFRRGIEVISGDVKIDFNKLLDNLDNVKDEFFVGDGKSKVLKGGKKLQSKFDEVDNLVDEWRANPALHTAEGIDALKIAIDDLFPGVTDATKPQQKYLTNVKNAIKDQILEVVPEYSKVLADYSEASDLVKELERALIGGQKAAVDTSLRKLQSVMRNNVNTNFGNRLELLKQIESVDDLFLQERLAGQSLNQPTARGIQGGIFGPSALALGAAVDPVTGLIYAAGSSPRLQGSAAFRIGTVLRPGTAAYDALPQSMKDIVNIVTENAGSAAAISRFGSLPGREQQDLDLDELLQRVQGQNDQQPQ